MALTQLAPPYPIFTDKNGDPLDAGFLYFGVVNQNPETQPIQVYYDSAFTQPAAQPLRTSNGYVMRNGSPALIYADSQFSVTVRDKSGSLVIYSPVGYGVDPASISGTVIYDDFTGDGVTTVFTLTASPSTKNATNVYIDGVYQSKDNYNTVGSTLTFSTAPPLNSAIEVVSQESSIIGGASSQQITYNQGSIGAVTRTVQSRLRDFVSVKDFGAVGDGVTDDTAAIQAAIDSGALQITWPEGTYKFTQFGTGIFQEHHASGAVTLLTSLASGNAIEVSNEYGANPPLLPNGFYRQELFEGAFQLYNDNPTNTATGIYFGDVPPDVTYSAPNMHINGLVINKFLVSHSFGNNAYIIQFDNCTFYSRSVGLVNSKGVFVTQILTNSGGLINYDNCIFQGFENALDINLGGVELVFNKCSFDVCTHCLANKANDSVLRFTDCRWEWGGDTVQFNVIGNSVGCSVFINNPFVQFNGLGSSPANPSFAAIGNAGFMSIRSGVWRDAGIGPSAWCSVNGAGTLIYDPTYKTLGVGATVFANLTGAGVGSGFLREYLDTKSFSIPISNSTLTFRWGNISVASPNIAANAITDVDVTWTGSLTTVLAAFAQVYPTTSTGTNDFSGVVTSIPLTGTSHRFGIKNGPVAQGITGQFLILGYE